MDRFVLEEDIMTVWNSKNDIDLLMNSLLKGEINSEEVTDFLVGLSKMHDLRCKKLWDTFESIVENRGFSDQSTIKEPSSFYKKFNDIV